jgi:hypothetical protein
MGDISPLAHTLRRFFEVNKDFVIAGYAMEKFFADQHETSGDHLEKMATWSYYFRRILSVNLHHRLAFTIGGRLGLVPAHTRETDAIYALRGLDLLAVLRREDDAWRFVGACYVYGLMDGTSPDIFERLEEVEQVTIV